MIIIRQFILIVLVAVLISITCFAQQEDYGPNMDWFSAGEAQAAPVPDGLTEREAEIYRQGFAAGHYAALHPVHIEGLYVLNKRTKKFHYSECQNTLLIYADNRENYYGPKEELLVQGYEPCGACKP